MKEHHNLTYLRTTTQHLQFFRNAANESETFVRVKKNSGAQFVWPINSHDFRLYLLHRLYTNGRGLDETGVRLFIKHAEVMARFESKKYSVAVRVGKHGEDWYVDLADGTGNVVKITDTGYEVTDQCPLRFVQLHGMKPLPVPQQGGKVSDLLSFLNVREIDEQLVLSWQLMAFHPDGPYPLLLHVGEQGSGKSTAERAQMELIDPTAAGIREAPKNSRELIQAGSRCWLLPFDNLSSISQDLSDGLCRMSTGAGGYSTSASGIEVTKRPVVFNTIEDIGLQSDLLDRTICVLTPRLLDEDRRPEAEFWNDFNTRKPQMLGAIFDCIAEAKKRLPQVEAVALPRMADFARFAIAAEESLGYESGSFLAKYHQNRRVADQLIVESSSVGAAVRKLLLILERWEGTAQELLDKLNDSFPEDMSRSGRPPSSPRMLSSHLRRVAPHLRPLGFDIEFERTAEKRSVILRRLRELSAEEKVESKSLLDDLGDIWLKFEEHNERKRSKPEDSSGATNDVDDAHDVVEGEGVQEIEGVEDDDADDGRDAD
jgi:hypothetical protein